MSLQSFGFKSPEGLPLTLLLLGVAGLVPFLAAAWGAYLALLDAQILSALVGYGAIILAFMGAIHWGLALATQESRGADPHDWYSLSVIPALVGWSAVRVQLLSYLRIALIVLIAGFLLVFAMDVKAVNQRFAPRWYLWMRIRLTVVVVFSLIATIVNLNS